MRYAYMTLSTENVSKTNITVTEPKGSTPFMPMPAITHDPELVSATAILSTELPMIH
jgi:hypothetical protein